MSILLGWYLRKTAVLQKLPLQFSCSFCFVPLSDNSCEQLKIRSTFKMKFVNCFNIAHFISQHSKHINGSHVVKLYEYDLRSPLSRLLTFINSVTISNVFFAMFNIFKTFYYQENLCLFWKQMFANPPWCFDQSGDRRGPFLIMIGQKTADWWPGLPGQLR